MSSGSQGVRVKLKRGAWEIEITCPEDRIQQTIESVLAGLRSGQPEIGRILEAPSPRSGATSRSLLDQLWRESWFSEERSLSDAHEELARRGFHYDKTAVSHSLTDLVRENILTRVGQARNYRYVQKRPPETGSAD